MSGGETQLSGPDFAQGVPANEIREGRPLLGHAQGEPVLLARAGGEIVAVAATCPHYGGPLGEGLQVGNTIRCPWHHASFDLRTGKPTAPAINPIGCFEVARTGPTVRVVGRRDAAKPARRDGPRSVLIVGGGAAGHAAAEELRRLGYGGPVTILSADPAAPCDRPNLSKDYLAGTAPEEWIPLRAPDDYAARAIELRLDTRVESIDPATRRVRLSNQEELTYGALLLATGAAPVRLDIPGADAPHVLTLRSLADARAIIARAKTVRRAVMIGASFIGLECAASLRERGVDVDVVGLERTPLERVFGAEAGAFIRRLHEAHGVRFHLESGVRAIDGTAVVLSGGERLEAELVIVGVGVRPEVDVAQRADLKVDRGVLTNEFLETSQPGIWAAGDVARWPSPWSGKPVRIEHWAVAQRQGQTAAANILGERTPYRAVPFFWTVQHGVRMAYVGHAEQWDRVDIAGRLEDRDATVRYYNGGKLVAALTVGRDAESLAIEADLERALGA